jgi:tetratricopeptide (TPR) repeat protein
MNMSVKIVLFLLFIAAHLNIYGLFVEAYALFYVSCFAVICLSVWQKKQEKQLHINSLGVALVSIVFVSYLLHFFLQGNQYGQYSEYTTLICWLLFFVFATLFSSDRHIIKWAVWIVIISIMVEIVLGFGQLFGWIQNNNMYFRIGGSFGNPGIYAGYLAVVSPMILSVLLLYRHHRKAENISYLLATCLAFSIFMILLSKSRGAWLACALGFFIVLNHNYSLLRKAFHFLNSPVRKALAFISLISLVLVGTYMLYHFKADSALGRVLVWKVSLTTPHTGLLLGNGTGHFEANYGKWQSAYFAAGKGSEAERYVADYVTCAYNEFIETTIEQGFVGLLLLLALLYFAFRQKNSTNSSLVSGAKASLSAILALMCVSYPFKSLPVYLYFIFCLAVVFRPLRKEFYSLNRIPLLFGKTAVVLLGLFIVSGGLQMIQGDDKVRKGQQLAFSNQLDQAIESYEKASSIFKNNGIFHFYYGSALYLQQQYAASIDELELSIQKSSNPNSYILLGNNYKETGAHEKAKQAYKMVINMQPSKLYPKYLLAKLHIDDSEYKEAGRWAEEILNTKEKVPTTAAKEIKEEMELFIKSRKY